MSGTALISELDSVDLLNQNEEGVSQAARGRESSEQDYHSQRLGKTLKQWPHWYERDIMFLFDFPEDFNQVPSIVSAYQAWAKLMDYNDVAGGLKMMDLISCRRRSSNILRRS